MNRCLTVMLKNKALLKGLMALMVLSLPQATRADITIGGNVYGGGNRGDMKGVTNVTVNSGTVTGSIFGGARMANVNSDKATIQGYASNVEINGGTINDVYGGNDITGNVYGGAKVAIKSSINGSVYGGGNGSYTYTDNAALKDNKTWGDFYYNPAELTELESSNKLYSIDALNKFRPNMGDVLVLLSGTAAKPTHIHGSVYCGGNSATLRNIDGAKTINDVLVPPKSHLEIGSYVYAHNVFLGSNGESMVVEDTLTRYGGSVTVSGSSVDYSTLDLTDADVFAEYMKGVQVDIYPEVTFPSDYVSYSSYIGSLFCGGNIGSMKYDGHVVLDFDDEVVIYEKLVGGSNNAYVAPEAGRNAVFRGGILGSNEDGNKLTLNIQGVKIEPKRWNSTQTALEWNKNTGGDRLLGGNIYGGCYNSGYVNGNVIINIENSIIDKASLFTASGISLEDQRNDLTNTALSVFGGGFGPDSEIWGSTTVNLNQGDAFKVFGGGEKGVIGVKPTDPATYAYNPAYSTYVNLNGTVEGVAVGAANDSPDMSEAEILYGGGFQGPVVGDTHVNLGKGRVFRSFGGSFDAVIYGHAETYMGRGTGDDSNTGFPWIVDNVYGGNDLGGEIKGTGQFISRVNSGSRSSVYQYDPSTNTEPEVTEASAYVEYIQGRAVYIFGGSNGDYDYAGAYSSYTKPYFENAFVNFKPTVNSSNNKVTYVFGAGQGYPNGGVKDLMQDRSYLLVDIPKVYTSFLTSSFFGGGAYSGVGMNVLKATADANASGVEATSIVDLVHGKISSAYGASYKQGVTRRTIVNVPAGSDIVADDIFAGGYGEDNRYPCDTYEAILNYAAPNATVGHGDSNNKMAIYGGNNNARRTLYSKVNITAPLKQSNGYDGYVFGAGKGANSWSQYTEVNILDGGSVYEAYGGGNAGKVLNTASVTAWNNSLPAADEIGLSLVNSDYIDNGLSNDLALTNQLYTDTGEGDEKYNTNVHIYPGGRINNYCYGGGLGVDATVSGTTYIDQLGGFVNKDMYAAGTSGAVRNLYESKGSTTFTATTHAYVRGGKVRNVYGGGWEGDVGYHDATTVSSTNDIPGETYVYIGMLNGTSYEVGIPTVHRNAYAGGEGGAVYGESTIKLYNGYIGYAYDDSKTDDPSTELDDRYVEKIGDDTYDDGNGWGNNTRLLEAGNVFGSGYADYSNSDYTNVYIYKGFVRNSVYGAGEIGTVGRGQADGTVNYGGEARVYMYGGHVMHDVFGGGRGFDNLNRMSAIGTSGYVFGKTRVYIYGGEVGTAEGTANGYGNVFGGGNIGYVYSSGVKKNDTDGYYYENDSYYTLTEDCSVIVAPACQVLPGQSITLNGTTYTAGKYVPAEDLNYLKNKDADKSSWDKLDVSGVIIRNAVFAGGNVSTGSDRVYANTVTVFGNATATLFDIYNRDLITIGTEHVGGLYGDGNLTFVDGYRELNVSNYGTDFYGLSDNISLEDYYNKLTDRERAYFTLEYKCLEGYTSTVLGKTFTAGDRIKEDDYKQITDADEQASWELLGFCTIYAGRLLNTLQRADFAGVFGSRMVLQGAQDRVPEVLDYTNYTINRVGELSLNKSNTQAYDTGDNASHGSYFGIYNIVNYLGALTSDVDFTAVRTTDNTASQYQPDPDSQGQTYEQWKESHINERKRNNGTSHNKVALASGVYLELTTEESTKDNKVWGLITGVCQLDLISVVPGIGGGYVYAKNEHGTRQESGNNHTILSPYNKDGYGHAKAVTNKIYTYNSTLKPYETSGNFIHNMKQIIDDCYPNSGSYSGTDAAPAHYWYIRGEIYVYDQYISAFTGSASAYSESINLPLTVTPASNGALQLSDVKENLYAYYDVTTSGSQTKIGENGILIGTTTYYLNDPITYWDWYLLSAEDRKHFVKETYTVIEKCKIGDVEYNAGDAMLSTELPSSTATALVWVGSATEGEYKQVEGKDVSYLVRKTNNISHDKGYILTYDMTNPKVWDRYYTPPTGSSITPPTGSSISGKVTTAVYNGDKSTYGQYIGAPTYTPTSNGVFGQRDYEAGDIIPNDVHTKYEAIGTGGHSYPSNQATVARAYVATDEVTYTTGTGTTAVEHHVYKGYAISETEYDQLDANIKAKFAPANVCTSTIELGNNEFVFYGTLLTDDEINGTGGYKEKYRAFLVSQGIETSLIDAKVNADFAASVSNAWYCTTAGRYGGDYYEASHNYRAMDAWSSMSKTDRANFNFNYDAFDALIDPEFEGMPARYDGPNNNTPEIQKLYSALIPVDYKATYNDTSNALTYDDENGVEQTVAAGATISREAFEEIPNEKRYYQAFNIPEAATTGTKYYLVKVAFTRGETPYTVGTVLSESIYNTLDNDQKAYVMEQTFTAAGNYFFCRKPYKVNENGEGYNITDINNVSHNANSEVPVGTIITEEQYGYLPNKQANFTIHGEVPIGTSTLYVSRESDINDLSEDKVITVIYDYTYDESDESGTHIEQITEKHVVNIHLQFKSGVPTLTELEKPDIVLPSRTVGLKQPNVTPGAFEIIGGGWELFTNQTDAEAHTNGQPYFNNVTPVYWYQDGYYVAYYAKSYLGKTYSNSVQISVANYHDLDAVMKDKEHHMFIDEAGVHRAPKIYIDNRTCESDPDKNELDLLKDFFDLTLNNTLDQDGNRTEISGGVLDGHYTVKGQINRGSNLEFFLKSDIAPKFYTNWTPIGNETDGCFEGVLHGDGYTISGLNNSLFGSLCGDVYNLGVTGSFTSAGIADRGDGFVQNSWIYSSATDMADNIQAIIGVPSRGDYGDNLVQIVNCYYPETNVFTITANQYNGAAIAKPVNAFYNGEVAYDLNGFYLFKRYSDHISPTGTTYTYHYLDANDLDDLGNMKNKEGKYAEQTDFAVKYVEARYEDGDFRYQDGYIPDNTDVRYISNAAKWYPIWPDDYLYFGQLLTYGHVDSRAHQDLPTYINKSGYRLRSSGSNRVYRAPAYFQSKEMSVAHFNPDAVFAAQSADGTHQAYPNMTAIDFTGYNDVAYDYQQRRVTSAPYDNFADGAFYPPLLDDDGLTSIYNVDLTRNLLVYIPDGTAAGANAAETKTYTVVNDYLTEPVYTVTDEKYRTVAANTATLYGHPVVKKSGSYSAEVYHFLVDKNDFNAPIEYTFSTGKRMWYQRIPDTYVDLTNKGWEGISLPFTAELVTTQTKGEITHFYSGSQTADESTADGTKVGHEYWLREFTSGGAADGVDNKIFKANFKYPDAESNGSKTVTNTFLYDYYYSKGERKDDNADLYHTYYNSTRPYEGYKNAQAATPYIIGFPGSNYYEFDLSGKFVPANTEATFSSALPKQTITFASNTGITIGVSDDELAAATAAPVADGYVFKANYMSKSVPAGTYVLNDEGSSFTETTAEQAAVPFRPYFTDAPTSSSPAPIRYSSLLIAPVTKSQLEFEGEYDPDNTDQTDELNIFALRGKIVVESLCKAQATVRIVNSTGMVIDVFNIQPGQVIETPISSSGIYFVNTKKLRVTGK